MAAKNCKSNLETRKINFRKIQYAGVVKLANTMDSKSIARKGLWVQVPPPALKKEYRINLTVLR